MATVKECEKLRGSTEVKLNSELRKLRKTCHNATPNARLVSNLLASLDTAYNYLVDAHVAYVMKMGSRSDMAEARHVQHIDKIEDNIDEVKNVALLIVGAREEDGTNVERIDKDQLKEDYEISKLRLEAESFVKKVKKTLTHTYGDKHLSFYELETALKRAACIFNSRPITAVCCRKGGVDPDYLQALTPNMMLLDRANNDVPLKSYEDTAVPLARREYVSEVEALFWNQFKVQDFHTLVPTYKWQEPQRNIASGDVVLIKYATKSKSGEYRLGRVVSVEVDPDQLVRTCLVRYSLVQHMSGKDRLSYKGLTVKYIRVAIQRLLIILPVEEQVDMKTIRKEEMQKAQQEVNKDNREEASKSKVKVMSSRVSLVSSMLKALYEFTKLWQETDIAKELQTSVNMVQG